MPAGGQVARVAGPNKPSGARAAPPNPRPRPPGRSQRPDRVQGPIRAGLPVVVSPHQVKDPLVLMGQPIPRRLREGVELLPGVGGDGLPPLGPQQPQQPVRQQQELFGPAPGMGARPVLGPDKAQPARFGIRPAGGSPTRPVGVGQIDPEAAGRAHHPRRRPKYGGQLGQIGQGIGFQADLAHLAVVSLAVVGGEQARQSTLCRGKRRKIAAASPCQSRSPRA